MAIKDFICNNDNCTDHFSMFPDKYKNLVVKYNETPFCDTCGHDLKQQFNEAPAIKTKGCSPASKPYSH